MVDRYSSECTELCHFPNDKGEWVHYSDYEALESKLDRLIIAASMACLCRMNYSKRGVNPALEEYQSMMQSLTDLAVVVEAVNSK